MFEQRGDFEIVGEATDALSVLTGVRDGQVDAVVVLASDPHDKEPGMISHLLEEYADLTVLAVLPTGEAFIAQKCTFRRSLHSATPAKLADALREAVETPCEEAGDATRH